MATDRPPTSHVVPAIRLSLFNHAFLLACLATLYVGTRLPLLLSIPLFNDEAVYLVRAQKFPRYLSETLGEGKLLQELLLTVLVRLPGDSLVLGRLLSVAAGLATLVLIVMIGRVLNAPGAGLLAALFYIGAPLTLLHDRLAVPDSLLTCLGAAVVLASLRMGMSPQHRRKRALVVGGLIGLSSLVKLPGLFLFVVPVLAVVILPSSAAQKRQQFAQLRLVLILALACVAALAPWGYGSSERGKTISTTLAERVVLLGENAQLVAGWAVAYLPLWLIVFPVCVLVITQRHTAIWRHVTFLLVIGFAFVGLFLVVGTTLYPRYLMPAWPSLLLASAISITCLWNGGTSQQVLVRGGASVLVGSALLWNAYAAWTIVRTPLNAPLVAADRRQYLETWSAGYGVNDLVAALEDRADRFGPVVLANHDQPRLIHLAPLIYLRNTPQITIESVDLMHADAQDELLRMASQDPTYLLLDEQEVVAFDVTDRFPDLEVEQMVEHPTETMRFYLYRVTDRTNRQ
jgi:4-amino-4-deoxy-L-arabinose transferase-like glycosyltransferase